MIPSANKTILVIQTIAQSNGHIKCKLTVNIKISVVIKPANPKKCSHKPAFQIRDSGFVLQDEIPFRANEIILDNGYLLSPAWRSERG